MSGLSVEEQVKRARKILGHDRLRRYYVKGKTFEIKKELDDRGCHYDPTAKAVVTKYMTGDDSFHKWINSMDGIYLEEVKS